VTAQRQGFLKEDTRVSWPENSQREFREKGELREIFK
jgi:hypothetical protein